MQYVKAFNRPALLIIALMVLINAGLFFYFDSKSTQADEKIQQNVAQLEQIAVQNRKLLQDFAQERDIRSDQACQLFETDHLKDVQQLRDTYKFLLDPDAANTGLVKFVILNLPRTEQEARTDNAPEYCDGVTATGADIGLPEPDPKIPERPKKLDALTKTITPDS